MRTFVALPIPAKVLQQIINATVEMRTTIKDGVRWTPPENLHLTLRFLGESNLEQLEKLQDQLGQLQELPAFNLNFTKYGVFPAWKRPSALWLGINKSSDLENLAKTVDTMAINVGYRSNKKPFRPHITLARIKRNPSAATIEQISQTFREKTASPHISSFQACHVVLFQSILSQEGAKYKALQTIELER